jgi:RNA polymerase sigma-70 factor (ECF subfamily)
MAADPQGFDAAVVPFRRELLAHCYRMTGSLADAEDALQESLVRAWRGLPRFEGRSSLRAWLYRVTTNACLNLIAARRARSLPHLALPAGSPDDVVALDLESPWLEPFPDDLLEADPATRPDAIYTSREAIRLAFISALQRLPGRQRATLILRDVVALSAEETAAALELTVAACNSLLQRARASLEVAPAPAVTDPTTLTELLARYLRAWEGADANALIALLRADAIASMPPSPLWVVGAQAVIDCMVRLVWSGGELRLVPYAANAAPAFAVYQRRGEVMALAALSVVELDGGAIAAIHSFLTADPSFHAARYGLAATLA